MPYVVAEAHESPFKGHIFQASKIETFETYVPFGLAKHIFDFRTASPAKFFAFIRKENSAGTAFLLLPSPVHIESAVIFAFTAFFSHRAGRTTGSPIDTDMIGKPVFCFLFSVFKRSHIMALRADKFVFVFYVFPILRIVGSFFETLHLLPLEPRIFYASFDPLLFEISIVLKIAVAGISDDHLRIYPM